MTGDDVVRALIAQDQTVLNRAASAPAGTAGDIERRLAELQDESAELAAAFLVRHNGPGTGKALLKMCAVCDLSAAAAAAEGLLTVKDLPAAGDVLAAVPATDDPVVRGRLYLVVGRIGDAGRLDGLRASAKLEKDADAGDDARAAAVKLGGKPERQAFIQHIWTARPDDVLRIRDHLFYIGDVKLAKALLPWLNKPSAVMRLGSDRSPDMARMCDLAVWISLRLGVKFTVEPEYLTNYGPSAIAACGAALEKLPE
jgi:hypothetical protein